MGRRVTLEDFDSSVPVSAARRRPQAQAAPQPDIDLEEERLAAFEKGYRAGWDDAAAAHADEQDRISAELGRNLQEMSFTYHEAHAALVREMSTIMSNVLDKVLHPTLRESLGAYIADRVGEATADTALKVEVRVAPPNLERVRRRIDGQSGPPVEVLAEPELGEGQAFLRLGAAEEKVDLDGLLAELSAAVEHFVMAGETAGAPAGNTPEEEKSYA